MNRFMVWLSEGNLKTDGRSDEAVEAVLNDPGNINDLMSCLRVENAVIRGNTADAIEKIGRQKPEFFLPYLHLLLQSSVEDPLPMVQWHLAMLFGHLALFSQPADLLITALSNMLKSDKSLVVSWAINSLCVYAKLYPDFQPAILGNMIALDDDKRAAVRAVVQNAKKILVENQYLPVKWIKSPIMPAQFSSKNRY